MSHEYLLVESAGPLHGEVSLSGAKNAVLVIMASLILTKGKSILTNVPPSEDVFQMILLLRELGAIVEFNEKEEKVTVDTSALCSHKVSLDIMKKMRASILVMGPLLARFGKTEIALPGGCLIGTRPIDYHLRAFSKMGASIQTQGDNLKATADKLSATKFVLEYPSVGATENILMAASLTSGTTEILNAALEPEVFDLIAVLTKMGASITVHGPATIIIKGVTELSPVEHKIMYDRLEAGTFLLAAAITGGSISIPQAPASSMDVFLEALRDMGHVVITNDTGVGVSLKATLHPKAISFKTMPYPGFPTDLQAPMMVAQSLAAGTSVVVETVFENRLIHIRELQKMGAQITIDGLTATIVGVEQLYGAQVIASDIRAGAALVLAGLVAKGQTTITGLHHLRRGYNDLEGKLRKLGAKISLHKEKQ